MVLYTGVMWQVLTAKESTWGTPVAVTKDLGLIQNANMSDENGLQRVFGATQRNAGDIIGGNLVFGGSIESVFQHGRILEYAIGTVAHALTTNDTKHTFTEADTLSSFTMELGLNNTSDVSMKYAGCMVNSLTLRLSLEGVLTWNAEIMAKTIADTTSIGTAVVSTLVSLPYFSASLKTGVDASEATLTSVQNLEITFKNNIEAAYGIGDRLPTGFTATERHYEFSFTKVFESKTEYDLFLGQAGSPTNTATPTIPSVIFNINNGVTLGSGRREVNVDFSNAYYQKAGTAYKYKGYIMQDFVGWAKALTTNGCYSVDNIAEASW